MKTSTGTTLAPSSLAVATGLWKMSGGSTYDVRLLRDPSGKPRLIPQRVERDESIEALRRIKRKDADMEWRNVRGGVDTEWA